MNGPIESLRALLCTNREEKRKGSASTNGGAENPSFEKGPWVDRSSYQIETPMVSRLSTQSSRVTSSFLPGQIPSFPVESKADDKQPTPRVSLLRQVTIRSKEGKFIRRNQVMGESKPQPVPPSADTDDVNGPASNYLDCEGVLTVDKEFRTGSFKAGNVDVKVSYRFEGWANLALPAFFSLLPHAASIFPGFNSNQPTSVAHALSLRGSA